MEKLIFDIPELVPAKDYVWLEQGVNSLVWKMYIHPSLLTFGCNVTRKAFKYTSVYDENNVC